LRWRRFEPESWEESGALPANPARPVFEREREWNWMPDAGNGRHPPLRLQRQADSTFSQPFCKRRKRLIAV